MHLLSHTRVTNREQVGRPGQCTGNKYSHSETSELANALMSPQSNCRCAAVIGPILTLQQEVHLEAHGHVSSLQERKLTRVRCFHHVVTVRHKRKCSISLG